MTFPIILAWLKATFPYFFKTRQLIGKALQEAPATITSGTLTIGQRYTIGTFQAGDDFSNVVSYIVSGTINTNGCVFVASGTTPTAWTNATDLSQDGSLFWISSDANGVVGKPMVNTLGGDPTLVYDSLGIFEIQKTGAFPKGKTTVQVNNEAADYSTYTGAWNPDDKTIAIETATKQVSVGTLHADPNTGDITGSGIITGIDDDGLIPVALDIEITVYP